MKVSHSWGVYDSYKHIRKNGWYHIGRPVKEHEFYSIIRGVNDYLAQEIAAGRPVTFPCKMGKLELWKSECGASIVDGKLKITYPIDWSETMKLWYEDIESRNKKILLRKEDPYFYRIRYCKHRATYENKIFYAFALNRFIKKALTRNIQNGSVDTMWEIKKNFES